MNKIERITKMNFNDLFRKVWYVWEYVEEVRENEYALHVMISDYHPQNSGTVLTTASNYEEAYDIREQIMRERGL